MKKHFALALPLALLALLTVPATPAAASATIFVNNLDAPGVGFNDPTPVAPIGGNPGTTLGEQRLNVFQFAADAWGSVLDSDATITVGAVFVPLGCSPFAATLGSAGTLQVFSFNSAFQPNIIPNVWYHVALVNALIGFDATPGPPDPFLGFGNDEIFAFFNSAIDNNPNCLPGNWYYGLDHDNELIDVDLLSVVMHEFGHGLGFANFTNESTGAPLGGRTDIFSVYTYDKTLGKTWAQMTNAERQFSAVNTGNVVWVGPNVTANASRYLAPGTEVVSSVGTFEAQGAFFGPTLDLTGVSGSIELADDGIGVATDACEPLNNSFAGNIALVDRGGCSFVLKVQNAEAAGASGVIVANNQPTGLPPMGGSTAVGIPSVGISFDDGSLVKANLPGVSATLRQSTTGRTGTDINGLVRLYAPPSVASGSSLSHWDTSATPNLLMEPFISDDLTPAVDVDLTRHLFQDLGWELCDSDGDGVPNADDACPASDLGATVVIDGCDSGVGNLLFADGCTITDLVLGCADGAGNHGQFVSCATQTGNGLVAAGVISGSDKGAITSCAAQSSLP